MVRWRSSSSKMEGQDELSELRQVLRQQLSYRGRAQLQDRGSWVSVHTLSNPDMRPAL